MLKAVPEKAQDIETAAPDVLAIWRATFTERWHADPDLAGSGDRVSGHSGRTALLIIILFPDAGRDLVDAALIHDLGESEVGDVSATAKRADPILARRLELAEEERLAGMRLVPPALDVRDGARLKLADRLDAFLWMRHKAPWLEVRQDWSAARAWLEASGASLGLGPFCRGVL